MKLKKGVYGFITAPMLIAAGAVESIWKEQNLDPVITSIMDGNHSGHDKDAPYKYSDHYQGKAFDVRIWDLNTELAIKRLKEELPAPEWFVLLHEGSHIHISWRGEL